MPPMSSLIEMERLESDSRMLVAASRVGWTESTPTAGPQTTYSLELWVSADLGAMLIFGLWFSVCGFRSAGERWRRRRVGKERRVGIL